MFRVKEVGLALDSRECVILTKRRKGELEELRYPSLAQVRGDEVRAVGQRAHRLVGKSLPFAATDALRSKKLRDRHRTTLKKC